MTSAGKSYRMEARAVWDFKFMGKFVKVSKLMHDGKLRKVMQPEVRDWSTTLLYLFLITDVGFIALYLIYVYAAINVPVLQPWLVLLEDGGKMIAMSYIAYFVLSLPWRSDNAKLDNARLNNAKPDYPGNFGG